MPIAEKNKRKNDLIPKFLRIVVSWAIVFHFIIPFLISLMKENAFKFPPLEVQLKKKPVLGRKGIVRFNLVSFIYFAELLIILGEGNGKSRRC